MTKDITQILKEATKDVLSEQTLNEIKQTFDTAVDSRATEKVKIHVEKALNDQDAEYTTKLQKLINAIDKDHTQKLYRIVETIDRNHTGKLMNIVKHYEKSSNKDAKMFKESLVSTLSKYLNVYLKETVPQATLKKAVENKRAEMLISDLRKMLAVDQALANESIREAVMDGKTQIDELNKALKEMTSKHVKLQEGFNGKSAELILEKKIQELPEEKQEYMKRMMNKKSPEYINENFEYVLNLFDKTEEQSLEILKEQATSQTNGVNTDTPIQEKVESESGDPTINTYMNELGKW